MSEKKNYARVVWLEGRNEYEGVCPINWIIKGFVFWPTNELHAKRYFRDCMLPDPSWDAFEVVKIKCRGDLETCELYEFCSEDDCRKSSVETLKAQPILPQPPKAKKKKQIEENSSSNVNNNSQLIPQEDSQETQSFDINELLRQQNVNRSPDVEFEKRKVPNVSPAVTTDRSPKASSARKVANRARRIASPLKFQPKMSPRKAEFNQSIARRRLVKQKAHFPLTSTQVSPQRTKERDIAMSMTSNKASLTKTTDKNIMRKNVRDNEEANTRLSVGSSSSTLKRQSKAIQQVFPLSEAAFQKKVIYLLTEIKNLLMENMSSLAPEENLFVRPCDTNEELDELESVISDEGRFTQLVRKLARVGGTDIKASTRNSVKSVMSDGLQSLFNLHGLRGKEPFNKLLIYNAVIESVCRQHKKATIVQINSEISDYLKRAPDRQLRQQPYLLGLLCRFLFSS